MIVLWFVIFILIRGSLTLRPFKIDRYSEPTQGENVMICYFTSWSGNSLEALRISQKGSSPLCTHVIYAFLVPIIEENKIILGEPEPLQKFAKEMRVAKNKTPNLKSILGFGGTLAESIVFSDLTADLIRTESFIDSVIALMDNLDLDGINLDWHYPTIGSGSSPQDRINYPKFLAALNRRFDDRYLLTITLPRHSVQELDRTTLLAMYDMEALNKIVDYYILLGYDYDTDSNLTSILKGNSTVTFHHSPLFGDDRSSLHIASSFSVDTTVTKYLEAGINKTKMILGLPLYGRHYTLRSNSTTGIQSPAQTKSDQKWDPALFYYQICTKINDENWVKIKGTDAAGPYAFGDGQWVSFDDVEMVQNKVEYVNKLGLGGIGFWEMSQDDFADKCGQGSFPIMSAAKKVLNHIVQGCGEVLRESRGIIHSPNYPAEYSNQMFCHWTIEAPRGMTIHLTFQDFNVTGEGKDCSSGDKVTIDGKSFCGDISMLPKNISSTGNSMIISFITDVHDTGKGFSARYVFIRKRDLVWGCWSPCSRQCGVGIRTRNYTSSVASRGNEKSENGKEENCTVYKNCCGDISKGALSGVISSPNFPDFYDNDRKCEWTLEAPVNMFVKLTIEEFDVEFGTKTCKNDYLNITGSRGTDETYCGTMEHQMVMYSTNNKMVLIFQTDKQIYRKGFRAAYEYVSDVECIWSQYGEWSKCSLDCGEGTQTRRRNKIPASGNGNNCEGSSDDIRDCVIDCCSQILTTETVLKSRNFPKNYDNNLTCHWKIDAQHGMFVKLEFDILFELEEKLKEECEYDKMMVTGSRGWDNTYCGDESPAQGVIYSLGNQLNISFITDPTHTRRGFSAKVTFVENVDCVLGDYQIWSQCSTTCGIGEKKRKRKKYPAIGSGQECDRLEREEKTEECNLGQCCGGELTNTSGDIQSPNNGDDYENDKECTWKIVVPSERTIQLDIDKFDIAGYDGACGDDRLVIQGSRFHDHAYCGNGKGTIFADRNLTIKFITNGYKTRTGFSANYNLFDCFTFQSFISIVENITILTAVIGIIFNVIVIVIFSNKDMDNVINRLFTAIAFFDVIYLIVEIVLNSIEADGTSQMTLLNILYPLWHITTTTTMFVNIAAAVERYIAVYHPFKTLQSNEDLHSRRKTFLIYFVPVLVFAILFAIPAITEHKLVIENEHLVALPNGSTEFEQYALFYYWSLVQICLTIAYVVAVAILHLSLIVKQKSQSYLGKQPNWKENSRLTLILLSLAFLDFISVIPRLILFLSIQTTNPSSLDLIASMPNLVMKLTSPLAIYPQCGTIHEFPVLYWNEIACILRVVSCSLNFVILCVFGGKFRMSLCGSISKMKKIVHVTTSSKYEVNTNDSGQNNRTTLTELNSVTDTSINIALGNIKEDVKINEVGVPKQEEKIGGGLKRNQNQKKFDSSISI